jgi:pimeloyl-ACP methyl ester carboxylesterase
VRLAGGVVEVRTIGRATADEPAIVMLHEGLGSVSIWRDLPERLAERTGLAVVAYSRLGYGWSDGVSLPRPPTFLHDEADGPLPALLDALGVRDVILFGHSDGATIALLFAARFPGRVRGAVVLAPHLFVEDVSLAGIQAAGRAYEGTDLRARLARHHLSVDVAFRGWHDTWLDSRFAEALRLDCDIGAIRAPILAIQGDQDEYGTFAQLDALASGSGGPVETRRLAGVGHSPHRDREGEVLGESARFIDALFSRDRAASWGIVQG